MHRGRVFQLGDVHLPEHEARELDLKDKGFSDALVGEMLITPLRHVIRELQQQVTRDDIVILHGDLTSRGDVEAYAKAAILISDALRDPDTGGLRCSGIYVVPGNHDINRPEAVAAPAEDLAVKFKHMEDAWGGRSGVEFMPHECLATRLPADGGPLQILLLNSCIGCGEPRGEEEKVKSFERLLMDHHGFSDIDVSDFRRVALDYVAHGRDLESVHAFLAPFIGDQESRQTVIDHFPIGIVDAPMFRQEDLEVASDAIAASGPNVVNLVVAHHPILPQELPRVDLYPELINAGQARTMLMGTDRTVVYMHGHTHSDPVEEVRRFRPTIESLLTIGVPELAEGFNVVEFEYDPNYMPLGAIVTFIGNRRGIGPSANLEPVRVQLPGARRDPRPAVRDVYDRLLTDGRGPYSSREAARTLGIDPQEVSEMILELEWHGRAVVLGERQLESIDFRIS